MLLDAVDQPLAECQLDSDDGLVNRQQQQQQQQQLEEEDQQQDKEPEDQSLELTLLRKMCLLGDAEDCSNTEEPGKVRVYRRWNFPVLYIDYVEKSSVAKHLFAFAERVSSDRGDLGQAGGEPEEMPAIPAAAGE